jgi:multiple sugar transport system permease protein
MADVAKPAETGTSTLSRTRDRQDHMGADSALRRVLSTLLKVGAYAWLVVFALATALPLIWMLSTAIKPNELVLKMPPVLIPAEPTLDHFRTFFKQMNAWRWILNSVIVVTVITVAHVAFYTLAGYAFAKLHFPGRRILFGLVLATLTIPLYVILVPLYKLMVDLGWINSYQGLILPALVGPASLFLMKQFMSTLPSSLIDSARVDACPEWRIFTRIVVPLARPGIAVLAIFTFMGYWNSFIWPLVVTTSSEMRVLTVGLTLVRFGPFDFGSLMAGSVIAALPMFVVFLAFQRYFLRGLTVGAVKG